MRARKDSGEEHIDYATERPSVHEVTTGENAVEEVAKQFLQNETSTTVVVVEETLRLVVPLRPSSSAENKFLPA